MPDSPPNSPNGSPPFDPPLLSAALFDRALRQMVESNRFGMVIMDSVGRVVWCNSAFTEKFGYSREEAMGEVMLPRLVGPGMARADMEALAHKRSHGGGGIDEFLGFTREGHAKWVEVFSQPVFDDDGAPTGYFLAIDRDISQIKLARALEMARRTALERLGEGAESETILTALILGIESVFPDMRGSINLLDSEGRRIRTAVGPNLPQPFMESLRGAEIGPEAGTCGTAAYTGRRVISRDIQSDPKWVPYRELAVLSGMRSCWSEPIRDVGGGVIGTFALYSPAVRLPSPDEQEFLHQAAALTSIVVDRKRLDDDLRAARKRAEDASLAKSRFLANMSHELRTPLNAVIGFSELISAGAFHEDVEKYTDFASEIANSARTLLALISTLLDSANLQQGTYQLDERVVDLKLVIDAGIKAVDEQAHRRHVSMHVEWPESMPVLYADPGAAEKVLTKILDNALKFSPEGGDVYVTGQVANDGNLVVCVSDGGEGIPGHDVERVLEPFEQGGDASAYLARKYGGTGLGLAICHSLMQLHGGDVVLRSIPGEGTRARIVFPASRVIVSRHVNGGLGGQPDGAPAGP
jgi:two-component system cell cycle sensor histidine kinase PleC